MPITKKHFEMGINKDIEDWMKKIHTFLEDNKESAYTIEELKDSLGVKTRYDDTAEWKKEIEKGRLFELALNKLIEIDCVESREIGITNYYATGRRDLKAILAEQTPSLR